MLRLSEKKLEEYFKAWNLSLPPMGRLSLFALRGALPAGPGSEPRKNWTLRPALVDYQHMRCTLGIWERGLGKIFLAPGSTVPHRSEVLKAAERGGVGANQMEPGCYTDFEKGEHLMGKPKGHAALRQTGSRFIRRTSGGVPYSRKDRLFYSNPYDNLHCAWNKDPEVSGFSSSGCLVVAGRPQCPRLKGHPDNQGAWKIFHSLLYRVRQKQFGLVLWEWGGLTASLKPDARDFFLMFGSRGQHVAALQQKLKEKGLYRGRLHGRLDARTYKAWDRSRFKVKGFSRG